MEQSDKSDVSEPQVAVVGINPGTAGCTSIFFATIGLPVLAYIQSGNILRGVINQAIYFVALGLAFIIPIAIGGNASEAANRAGDENAAGAAAFGGLLGAPLLMGFVWFAWIILTTRDVKRCVKDHNKGKGVKYT